MGELIPGGLKMSTPEFLPQPDPHPSMNTAKGNKQNNAAEQRAAALLQLSSDWYWEQDTQHRFKKVAGAVFEKSKIHENHLLGKACWECDATPYSDDIDWLAHQAKLEARESFSDFIYKIRNSQGEWRYISTSGAPAFDGTGKFEGYYGIARDVTDKILVVESLRNNEARYRSIIDLSTDWYWEQDVEGRVTVTEGRVRAGGERIRGNLIGKTRWEAGYQIEGGWDAHRALLEAHEPFYDVVLYRSRETTMPNYSLTSTSGRRYIRLSGIPMFDAEGRYIGYRGIGRDITEQKNEEDLLRLEHAVTKCLAVVESSREAIDEIMKNICAADCWSCGQYWSVHAASQEVEFTQFWMAESCTSVERTATESMIGMRLPTGNGLAGATLQSKEITNFSASQSRDGISPGFPKESGIQDAFGIPILSGREILGVIIFSSPFDRAPSERMTRTMRIIGSQIGQFLQRKNAESVLRESEARFRSLTNLSSDWYWEQDAQLRFIRQEGRHPSHDQKAFDDELGKTFWDIGFDLEEGWDAHRAKLDAHQPFLDVVMRRLFSDGLHYARVSGEPIFDAENRYIGYRGVGRDITEQKRAEEHIQYLATHDGLTGLPNRTQFNHLLSITLKAARRHQRRFAVLFLDLDRFKIVNDTLGHDAGDILLKEISTRLRQCLRDSDVIARLGGDEFVVLAQEVNEPSQVSIVADKILLAAIQPVIIFGQECRVTASIGICMFPDDAEDEQSIIKNADAAMYRAKEEGKNNYQFYSKNIQIRALERMTLETGLRRALERNEFSLRYQAKLDFKSGKITGVEALLRWNSKELGEVPPVQFIPIADDTGLIVPIGKWVLNRACAQNVAWQRQGLPPICISVNISACQFNDELLVQITKTLEETGMDPSLLELELTEGTVMSKAGQAVKLLSAIKRLGVRIALDDFGTAYSSLSKIQHFPIDTLKVDRSFIREIAKDAEGRALTEAIIAMGKALSLTVVAEGVETHLQQSFLSEHDCDEMQGYYFSKPVIASEFADLLRTHVPAARQ